MKDVTETITVEMTWIKEAEAPRVLTDEEKEVVARFIKLQLGCDHALIIKDQMFVMDKKKPNGIILE